MEVGLFCSNATERSLYVLMTDETQSFWLSWLLVYSCYPVTTVSASCCLSFKLIYAQQRPLPTYIQQHRMLTIGKWRWAGLGTQLKIWRWNMLVGRTKNKEDRIKSCVNCCVDSMQKLIRSASPDLYSCWIPLCSGLFRSSCLWQYSVNCAFRNDSLLLFLTLGRYVPEGV